MYASSTTYYRLVYQVCELTVAVSKYIWRLSSRWHNIWCLGRKDKTAGKESRRPRNTKPFIVRSRSAGPTPATCHQGSPNVHRYSPIVRAVPINSVQQGSPAGGFGDLGRQNLGGSTAGINASISMRPDPDPALRTSRSPPPSAVSFFNHSDPVAGRPTTTPSVLSSSTATNHVQSPVHSGPEPRYHLNVSAHSSLV